MLQMQKSTASKALTIKKTSGKVEVRSNKEMKLTERSAKKIIRNFGDVLRALSKE